MMRPTLLVPAVALAITAAAAPAPKAPKPAAAKPAEPARTLLIKAMNYAFDMPDTVAAGRTLIRLQNKGPELHHAWLIRLDAGHTFGELLKQPMDGPPPAWLHDVGGPNAPAPGAESAAVVDLAPGTYAVVCFIPSADGKIHLMKGMAKELTVVPAAKARAIPASNGRAGTGAMTTVAAPDVTLDLSDYAFTFSKPLAAGRHVIRVSNRAQQTHEVFVARLGDGKTAGDLLAWIEKMQGPPPGLPLGGLTGMAHGVTNDLVLDLAPGKYALFCFVPDAKDGKPHVAHGMMKEFAVQ